LQQAKKMLDEYSDPADSTSIKSDCVKILVEIDRPAEALQWLEKLWVEYDRPDPELPECENKRRAAFRRQRLVDVYAYLGDPKKARELADLGSLDNRIKLECLIVWCRHIRGQALDLSKVLGLVKETYRIAIPKDQAYMRIGMMELLLAMGAYEYAWQLLDQIPETLHRIGSHDKLSSRLANVRAVLWPYRYSRPSPVLNFVGKLYMGTTSHPKDLSEISDIVDGMMPFVKHWTGKEGLERIDEFLFSLLFPGMRWAGLD